jgi:hypothetical protein
MSKIREEGVPLTVKASGSVVTGGALRRSLAHVPSEYPRTPLVSMLVTALCVRPVIVCLVGVKCKNGGIERRV